MASCVDCVKGVNALRCSGVVESRSGVGVMAWESLLGEDLHGVYISVRCRRNVVMWRSIGVRMIVCRGCG